MKKEQMSMLMVAGMIYGHHFNGLMRTMVFRSGGWIVGYRWPALCLCYGMSHISRLQRAV